jgi:hypothetical protein
MGWSGWLWFFVLVLAPHRRYCLCNEVMLTEKEASLATGFYNLQPTLEVVYFISQLGKKR